MFCKGVEASRFEQEGGWFDRFYFDVPFSSVEGRSHSDLVEDQWRRRTILTTEDPFPALIKRQPVLSKKSVDLAPIENAVEAVKLQTIRLRGAVSRLRETVTAERSLTMGEHQVKDLLDALRNNKTSKKGGDYVDIILSEGQKSLLEGYLPSIINAARAPPSLTEALQKVF